MATAGTLPSRPAWLSHKERADHAFKAGHYAEATTLYTDAVNACGNILPSEYAKLYANRALAFQRAGKLKECVKDGMSALSHDHTYVKGWWRLGTALDAMKLKEEALQTFKFALQLDPGNTEILGQAQKLRDQASSNGIGSNGRDLQSLKQQVLHCIASAQAKLNGDGPPKQNGHAHPGVNGMEGKSKQAQKRARQKARKAAASVTAATATAPAAAPPVAAAASPAAAAAAPAAAATNGFARGDSATSVSGSSASSDEGFAVKMDFNAAKQEAPEHKEQPAAEVPPAAAATPPAVASTSDPSEEQRAKGTKLYQTGDWQGALNAYKAAAEMAPSVPANFANCAAAALMLRQYKEAAEFARQAAALDPAFVRAHMRAGKACLLMGRFDQAIAHYQSAVDLDSVGTAAQAELASVHAVRKQLADGNAVLDSDPRQAQWYADLAARQVSPALLEPAQMLRCKALLRQGKHAKALGETRSLTVEGDPAAAEVLMVQAEALYGSGNLEKAIKMYEEALRRDPDFTQCARALKRVRVMVAAKEAGNAAFKAGNWGEAHRHYSAALSHFVSSAGNYAFFAQCFSNRSATCAKMRRKQDALADAEEAVSCDPSFVKGFLRRASAHEALEQWEEAVHDYEKVKEMDAQTQGINQMLRDAMVALKKSKRVDYYKLLEVSQDATEYDIKKAYKRAALRYHPDKAPAEERVEAEKKFKQVGAAHAILSDPSKRQKYDAGWTDEEIEQGCQEGGYGGHGGVDMDDLLAAMFRQQRGSFGHQFGGGGGSFGGFGGGGRNHSSPWQ